MTNQIDFDPNLLSQDYILKLIEILKVGSHDEDNGCRVWHRSVNSRQPSHAYGQIRVLMPVGLGEDKKSILCLCHRIMLSLATMKKIPPGYEASHRCHNPKCIRVGYQEMNLDM